MHRSRYEPGNHGIRETKITMKGYLIYGKEEFQRNRWFADELIRQAALLGVGLQLKIVEKTGSFYCRDLPDFAIVRVMAPAINKFFEQHKIPVFNNYKTSYYANNKWFTYELAKKLGIPVMPTCLPQNELTEHVRSNFPFILKSLNGHGGKEVFVIHDEQEYLYRLRQFNDNCLIQKMCSDVGKDVRVYCLENKILAAALRINPNDFRSNFSLGGNAELFDPATSMKETVRLLYHELNFTFVGIDFIYDDNRWILNEIEDVVGTRILYKHTNLDPASVFIDNIIKKLNG